jgi:hypothetical protein
MTTPFDPLDHVTPQADLDALRDIATACVTRQSSPISRELAALEVGSWAGLTALVLESQFNKVFCVDTWEGTPSDRLGAVAQLYGRKVVFETFCRNMGAKLHRSIFPCVGYSVTWASVWTRPLDLVFIDADHTYDACALDIHAWRKHVAPGGVLCGHDYGSFDGVTRAVDTFFPDRKVAGHSIWYWEVPVQDPSAQGDGR